MFTIIYCPREHCQKVTLDNLSKLQFQLENLQLQKVSDNLFRANKYLASQEAKTWNHLLNRHRELESSDHDLHLDFQTEFDGENSNRLGPDIETPESSDIDQDNDEIQPPDAEPPGQAETDQDTTTGSPAPQLDVYGQPDPEEIEQPHLVRRTRSGRSYNSVTGSCTKF